MPTQGRRHGTRSASQASAAEVKMVRMISVVIPLLNEAESLGTLYGELTAVADAEGYDLEIVFVDDGSTDGSWRGAAAGGGRSAGARNSLPPQFRQAAALSAGFRAARGELIFYARRRFARRSPRDFPVHRRDG